MHPALDPTQDTSPVVTELGTSCLNCFGLLASLILQFLPEPMERQMHRMQHYSLVYLLSSVICTLYYFIIWVLYGIQEICGGASIEGTAQSTIQPKAGNDFSNHGYKTSTPDAFSFYLELSLQGKNMKYQPDTRYSA